MLVSDDVVLQLCFVSAENLFDKLIELIQMFIRNRTDPDGIELQLELNNDPAAKTFQESKYSQKKPAIMFYVNDVQAEEDRIKSLGGTFTMPTTKVTGSTIAMLDDTCGNIVQLVALDKWGA